MKKITSIFLLFFFVISQSGMAITVHNCRGKLSSISFFRFADHPCRCGKKPMKPGCCKDKTTVFNVKGDLAKVNQLGFNENVKKHKELIVNYIENQLTVNFHYFITPFYKVPPYKPKVSLHLLDGVFLI